MMLDFYDFFFAIDKVARK